MIPENQKKNNIHEQDTVIKKLSSASINFKNKDLHKLFIQTLFWID